MPHKYAMTMLMATILVASPIHAQEEGGSTLPKADSWAWGISSGAMYGTDSPTGWMLPGARSSGLLSVVAEHGRFFISTKKGIGYELVKGPQVTIGAGLGYLPGRSESEDPRLKGLGDVPSSPALMVSLDWHPLDDFLHAYVSLLRATREGSGSSLAAGATLGFPVQGRLNGFVDVSETWGDRTFVQQFFGVESRQMAPSGYSEFHPKGGRVNTAAVLGLAYPFSRKWAISGTVGQTWLRGDSAESPIPAKKHHATATLAVRYSVQP